MPPPTPLRILITGSNRGIGLSTLHLLATRSPQHHYILGTRSLAAGTSALASLHAAGIPTSVKIEVLELDVCSDGSVRRAERWVRGEVGGLNCLVNNAGIPVREGRGFDVGGEGGGEEGEGQGNLRKTYAEVYNTNVTSISLLTSTFLPLMKQTSSDPRVINVSSARGSISLAGSWPAFPGTEISAFAPYMVSKAALNMLTMLFAKEEEGKVGFWACTPGLCKTQFSGWREGAKEPEEGARVIAELVEGERGRFECGFWEFEEGGMRMVPW
ncbi:MAG: hypothetical protein M1812_005320 [Candelaria pacifica]|nr:MAG: hypothetical protein M1812_005320 [Candelaria pacifica]